LPNCATPSPNRAAVTAHAQPRPALTTRHTPTCNSFKTSQSSSVTGLVELYNLSDRANFGANYGTNAFAPATCRKPLGYLGGLPGSSATVPASFQVQLGARFSF